MKGVIGAMAMVMMIAGLVLLPSATAGTVTATRNALDLPYEGTVAATSTTGGIMGAPAPDGVSHQGVGDAYLTFLNIHTRIYRTPVIQFKGEGFVMKQDANMGIVVWGIEKYQPDGDLQFASTRVWVWGVSFKGGWYYHPLSRDYVSSTCDASPDMGFQ